MYPSIRPPPAGGAIAMRVGRQSRFEAQYITPAIEAGYWDVQRHLWLELVQLDTLLLTSTRSLGSGGNFNAVQGWVISPLEME